MSNVFVIINEWTTTQGGTTSEPVDWIYWQTENGAWKYLRDIAAMHGIELDRDDYSFSPETLGSGIEHEEYYIQELNAVDGKQK